ncbi:olfactory receptor 5AR1-like [Discoglossus pictus]
MNTTNQTTVIYFIFKGITDDPKLQVLIFFIVLLIYFLTLGGNMTILLLVCFHRRLHTPMYFFLVNLSMIDISSTTVTLHKIIIGFMFGDNTISILGCMTQFYFYASLTACELLILSAMSFDRYVAICNPLHYYIVMGPRVCALLAMVCWVLGFLQMIPHILLLSGVTCYSSSEINHFYCDFVPLLRLICSDTSLLEFSLFIISTFLATLPSLLTFIPYVFIIVTILRIKSSTGRRKAFYTCSSHLTVVVLLYVTLVCQYLRPASMDSLDSNKVFSLFNTACVPLLNPLIYSLKNKDVKSSLKRTLMRCRMIH